MIEIGPNLVAAIETVAAALVLVVILLLLRRRLKPPCDCTARCEAPQGWPCRRDGSR